MNRQKARQGLIEIDGQAAGLVQILESSLCKNLFHALILDRGPLWLEGFGSIDHFEAFIKAFRQEFPARWGRKCRLIPEMDDTPALRSILHERGFKRRDATGYQTIWLDLRQDLPALQAAFSKSWRGSVKKAERSNLSITWDDGGRSLDWFLKFYEHDKALKNYDGPSSKFLTMMASSCAPQKNMVIGRALRNGKAIAAILLICHGSSATYQAGWTLEEGRKTAAHQFLLAQSLAMLKERNITDFDLGGVNDETAAGVKQFKEGMGGQTITLSGLFT